MATFSFLHQSLAHESKMIYCDIGLHGLRLFIDRVVSAAFFTLFVFTRQLATAKK